jgi:hypothetical protein
VANYIELPVYKASYDLLLQIFNLTHNLTREYKYTLGEKLKNEITILLSNIYRANRTREKEQHLKTARENLELVRLYIRILKVLRTFAEDNQFLLYLLLKNATNIIPTVSVH